MAYDFSGLTPRQQELLTFQGWQIGCELMPQPGPRTVRKLIDRGLVVEHQRRVGSGPFAMTVREYEVPLDVHLAWCRFCGKQTQFQEAA